MKVVEIIKSILMRSEYLSELLKLNKKLKLENNYLVDTGITLLDSAECPYCKYKFEKPITRKKKCPECQQNVYVRTLPSKNPQDKIRVAVTEQQADKIDIEWSKLTGAYDDIQKNKKQFEIMRHELKKSWGVEPSDEDIEWHLLINERLEHANNNQWGLYRNCTLKMAHNLYKLKKFELAMRMYLNVLYLDLNGPNNVGFINGKPRSNGRSFIPTKPYDVVAPGVVQRIVLIKEKRYPMSDEDVKTLFIDEANQVKMTINPPLIPISAWDKFIETEDFWGSKR